MAHVQWIDGREASAPTIKISNREDKLLRIRLLGGFEVLAGSQEVRVDGWRLRKAASLVKLLALSPKCRMHREQIIDTLWPHLDPHAATNNLHQALYVARRSLELEATPHYLRFLGDELVLCQEPLPWVDVEAFRAAATTARYEKTVGAYQQAMELYSGDLLPGDRYEEWAEQPRNELRELYMGLHIGLARLHEERGEYRAGIEALERVAALEPLREELHAGLMRLYALSGSSRKALVQYEHLQTALRRGLDVRPGEEVRRLHTEILENKFPPQNLSLGLSSRGNGRTGQAEVSRLHNLPRPRNSFIGREREMREVERFLAMTRVLTLTGTGGCGKTRLALEVSRELVEAHMEAGADAYTDGVWFVWLAALSTPEQVPRAVAAALGVTEQAGPPLEDTLADYLASKSLLLVFDNCEHLAGGTARLADVLLNACQNLKIMATSREPLGVAGEIVWPIPTLSLPDADMVPPAGAFASASAVESLPHAEAVRLFINRARLRLPAFQLNKENAGAVARICRTLDGIPLAIELAAGRMGALSVEQVAKRLEGSIALLSGGGRTVDPRHQTLRATLEWSHDLLSKPERVLFRRLSVFTGLFTLEAAEDVGSDGRTDTGAGRDANLDLIPRLIDKSLVVVTATASQGAEAAGAAVGLVGYRLLQPVKQYGLERLEDSGEAERTRERHARHYLALAEKAEPELIRAGQVAWLERLATEYPDLRTALHWFLNEEDGPKPEEHARMGLRMAAALGRLWGNRGSSEGREWLEKGLAKCDAQPNSPLASLRAKALNEAGFIAIYHLDAHAIEMFEEALTLYKRLGDQSGQAVSINLLAHTVGLLGNLGRAPTLRAEAEALLAQSLQDRRAAAYLHVTLGMIAMLDRDYQQSFHNDKALALFREVGDLRSCAQCLTLMGIAALSRGDAEDAARAYEQTLPLLRQLKDRIGIFYSLIGSAGVAVLRDRPARAARLFGAGEAVRKNTGHPAQPLQRINLDYESYLGAARTKMGETPFEAAFSEGLAMSSEQAIEYALSTDEPEPPAVPVPEGSASALTRREREVALLVARGLTNRQVAGELTVSERTVTTHVDHILHKLGATSRSQVAAWIVEERLLTEEGRRTSDSR